MSDYAKQLGAKLLLKGSAGYEAARCAAVWRANKPGRYPAAIVLAENAEDVVAGVRWARQQGLRVSAKSGGHLWTSPWLRDNAVLIDCSRLQQIEVNREARTAWAGPGTIGQDLCKQLRPHGLMATTGHHSTVAIGGFLMCGGFGWNSRAWGNGCANVLAVDVVTAEGELIRADATQNQDYYWAVRGSGPGFFGVVTRFLLRVHPLPPVFRHTAHSYPLEALEDLLGWAMEAGKSVAPKVEFILSAASQDGLGRWAPTRITASALAICDSDEEAFQGLAFMDTCPAIGKANRRRNALLTTLEERYESGTMADPIGYRYACDNLWTNAPAAQILPLTRELFGTMPTPRTHVFWQQWNPVLPLVDMAHSVQADLYIGAYTIWEDPAEDEAMMRWPVEQMRRFEHLGCGGQLNDENINARPQRYMSEEASARLERLRAQHDPHGVFVSFMQPGMS
ncbi:MAG: FAD-binding oxidoreductase [Steroidobacteraceae bacterium]